MFARCTEKPIVAAASVSPTVASRGVSPASLARDGSNPKLTTNAMPEARDRLSQRLYAHPAATVTA